MRVIKEIDQGPKSRRLSGEVEFSEVERQKMAGQSEFASNTTTIFACMIVQAARGFLVATATAGLCCKLKAEPLKLGTNRSSVTNTKETRERKKKKREREQN